jgi:glycosyltransferase involved in cell wall biosynthesis
VVFKVSVIIPVFNTAQYLTRAVQSAISLEEVGEVIIIDDGSQDASLDVAKGLSQEDVRVKFMQHPDAGNHGPAASRNLGIKNSGFR